MPFWKKSLSIRRRDKQPTAPTPPECSNTASPSPSGHVTGPTATPQPAPPPTQPEQPEPESQTVQISGQELLNKGDYHGAVAMLSKAVAADASNPQLFQKLAFAQLQSSPPHVDAALTNISKAIQLNPNDGISWKMRGLIFQSTGHNDQAIHAYSEAVTKLDGEEKQNVQMTLTLLLQLKQTTQAPPQVQVTPTPNGNDSQSTSIPPEEQPELRDNGHPLLSELSTFKRTGSQDLLVALTKKSRGSLYLTRFIGTGKVDQLALFAWGKTYRDAQELDHPKRRIPAHPAWEKCYWRSGSGPGIAMFDYDYESASRPGDVLIDCDFETIASYDGYHVGTASIRGYVEYYKLHQLDNTKGHGRWEMFGRSAAMMAQLSIPGLIGKINSWQYNESATELNGLDNSIIANARASSSYPTIELLPPDFLLDLRTIHSFSVHLLSGPTGVGLHKFLQHVLVGGLYSILMKKLVANKNCPSNVHASAGTNALIVLAHLWKTHATLDQHASGALTISGKHADIHAEGLLRFADAIKWPYMNEARKRINEIHARFKVNAADQANHYYHIDWLLGLVLPGKFFRHRILSCLVLACPSTKDLNAGSTYASGLVLQGQSYWPKTTILGKVLGSLAQSTCGWVGPLPAPVDCKPSWVKVQVEEVPLPKPMVHSTQTYLESCGFSQDSELSDPTFFTSQLANLTKWNQPRALPSRHSDRNTTNNDNTGVHLKATHLTESTSPNQLKASLEFNSHGQTVTFHLQHNPLFVHVPKCEGTTHPIHERLTEKLLKGHVAARDLHNKDRIPKADGQEDGLIIVIEAATPGEETMARAWCAQEGRHAIVRRGRIGCFACTATLASAKTGLNFNVIIWCT